MEHQIKIDRRERGVEATTTTTTGALIFDGPSERGPEFCEYLRQFISSKERKKGGCVLTRRPRVGAWVCCRRHRCRRCCTLMACWPRYMHFFLLHGRHAVCVWGAASKERVPSLEWRKQKFYRTRCQGTIYVVVACLRYIPGTSMF